MKLLNVACITLMVYIVAVGIGEAQTVREGELQTESNSTPTVVSGLLTSAVTNGISGVQDGGLDTIASRIANRGFPSIFAPWNLAESLHKVDGQTVSLAATETKLATISRHDLYWNEWGALGLKAGGDQPYIILAPQFTPQSIQIALGRRAALLAANPNLVILANVHYFSVGGGSKWLPPDSPWWLGAQKANEYGSRRLNFTDPEFQDKVAALCAALVKTGVFDGCMFDLWNAQSDNKQNIAEEGAARLSLIRKVRKAVGEKAILVANVNGNRPTSAGTEAYLNGMYMEGFGSKFFPDDWRRAAVNMQWGEKHLHRPAFTALEGWYSHGSEEGNAAAIQQRGRSSFARMRMITTLGLVFSDGYVLFSDPNPLPTPDHLHDWYSFWDKSLGKVVGPVETIDKPNYTGAYMRQFEKGVAVFNPPDNHSVTVSFQKSYRSAATGNIGQSFAVASGDGDLFLAVSQ